MRQDAVGMRTAQGGRRRLGRARVMGVAALTLASTLGVGMVFVAPGGATAKHPSASRSPRATTTTPTLAQIETELSALEALPATGAGTLTEAGSSLFYPLFEEWEAGHPPASLNVAAGGSGKGQSEAMSGTINIGASDAFLPTSDLQGGILNIPVVISSQVMAYNVPGIPAGKHIFLTPGIVNDIYDGAITNWNSPRIAKINSGLTLPNLTIVPVRRLDSSGDTFLFTSYLYVGDKHSWNHLARYSGPSLYYAAWPNVTGELAESGNTGVLAAVKATTGAIGYLGISYVPTATAEGVGYAALQNGMGHFILPTARGVEDEVASYTRIPSDGAISLIYSKSAPLGYPDVNFEYAIVLQHQATVTLKDAIQATLAWAMDPRAGAAPSFLGPVLFKPLPVSAMAVAVKLLKSITVS